MTAQEFAEYWKLTGLTQKELSQELGCGQSRISEWADWRPIPERYVKLINLRRENQALRKRVAELEALLEAGNPNNAMNGDQNSAAQNSLFN